MWIKKTSRYIYCIKHVLLVLKDSKKKINKTVKKGKQLKVTRGTKLHILRFLSKL